MNVKELRKELEKYPEDSEVFFAIDKPVYAIHLSNIRESSISEVKEC